MYILGRILGANIVVVETSFNVNCHETIEMNAVIVRFPEIKEFIMSGQ